MSQAAVPAAPPSRESRHDSLSRPRPRPARSPARLAQVRIQNRRRIYLERHPSYFQSSEHEFADPLLYDALIRRFQSPAEREAEGKARGYGRVLEGSLVRGEARLAKLAAVYDAEGVAVDAENGAGNGSRLEPSPQEVEEEEEEEETEDGADRYDGRQRWEEFLRDRFLAGEDEEFDYAKEVDGNDEYDDLERKEEEEAWFEDEEPSWVGEEGEELKAEEAREKKRLEGETGIQDF